MNCAGGADGFITAIAPERCFPIGMIGADERMIGQGRAPVVGFWFMRDVRLR